MAVLCWSPPSDLLKIRHPRLCFIMFRSSEVELCFQFASQIWNWWGPVAIHIRISVFHRVQCHLSTACPWDQWLCLWIEMSSVRFSPLDLPELHIPTPHPPSPKPTASPFLHLWMGEPVHTTQVHSGITEVPLKGTELWTKVQYCVLVTKCSLTEGTMDGEGHLIFWTCFSTPLKSGCVLPYLFWHSMLLYL